MIQRIQSVYLFLAALAMGAMFLFPLASFFLNKYSHFYLSLTGISDENFGSVNTIPLIITAIILIVLILSGIFAYKNRLLQIKIIRFGVLLNIGLIIILYFAYIDKIATDFINKGDLLEVQYKIGSYIPLISIIFLILAIRGVMKDEKKILAADRLR
jgi:hypothetical protein